jgi:DNA-binding response OmpR family regulator
MATRAQEALKPRHRVLIVDDEESTRVLLARLLSKELDVEAQLAGTCEQALRLAGNYAYDAILLDLLMPGIGGLGVLAAVRAASPNATTPVIIVSVVTDQETVDRVMAAGASAYHVKPIRRNELVATVRSQLAKRGQPKH